MEPVKVKNVGITVDRGALWATRTGDPVDYLVTEGQSLDLAGPGWVIGAPRGTLSPRYREEPLGRRGSLGHRSKPADLPGGGHFQGLGQHLEPRDPLVRE